MLIIAVLVLVVAVVALAVAVSAVSAVALLAQASAIASQCALALVVCGAGAAFIVARAMRHPIVNAAVAYRLLGDRADQVLAQTEPADAALPADNRRALPAGQPMPEQIALRAPAIPAGWGWDEEDAW